MRRTVVFAHDSHQMARWRAEGPGRRAALYVNAPEVLRGLEPGSCDVVLLEGWISHQVADLDDVHRWLTRHRELRRQSEPGEPV